MRNQLDAGTMPLLAHLSELRQRLIVSIIALITGFVISFFLYDMIITFLQKPFLSLNSTLDENSLYINSIFEGFVVKIKISAIIALILSSPVHIFNLVRFIFPGLHNKERKIIKITSLFSFIFIILSFLYSYYSILPISIKFLTNIGFIPENTGILLNFDKSISYVLQFILVVLVVFQIPIILEILLMLNVLNRKVLLKYGRYVVILFFILSAVLTPPDFVSQIGTAFPLTILYFLTILIAKIFKFGEE